MSVPLDRLYHFLDDVVNYDLLIYGWIPHGSTKLEDLRMIKEARTAEEWNQLRATLSNEEFKKVLQRNDHTVVICHDQEPLDIDRYSVAEFRAQAKKMLLSCEQDSLMPNIANDNVVDYCAALGFRGLTNPSNQCDLSILLHSEQNSLHVDQYQQQGYVPVYYWSHGMIALDWFRYAQHDPVLDFDPQYITHDFLVYNRAWSGTREYRLMFAEQVVEHNLVRNCKMSFNDHDRGHYSQHRFANSEFQISNFELEKHFPKNNHHASASADYNNKDYASTGIEVVLETLFDDPRWHLTEKSLRPIACGRPFMLMASAGSLQYLRQYGFQTFSNLIDESYDQIQNPRQRLQAVIKEMNRISALPQQHKLDLFQALTRIAQYNKHHFFHNFFDQVQQEYVRNMHTAMAITDQHRTGRHNVAIKQLMR